MMGDGIGSSIGRGAVYGTGRQLRMCMFNFHIGYIYIRNINIAQSSSGGEELPCAVDQGGREDR